MALQVLVHNPDQHTAANVHAVVVKVEGVVVAIDPNINETLWTTLGNSEHLLKLDRHVINTGFLVLWVALSVRQIASTGDGVQLALVALQGKVDDPCLIGRLQIELKVDLHPLGAHPAEVRARRDDDGARGCGLCQWFVMIQKGVEELPLLTTELVATIAPLERCKNVVGGATTYIRIILVTLSEVLTT